MENHDSSKWLVILRNEPKGQVVLYNKEEHALTVSKMPDIQGNAVTTKGAFNLNTEGQSTQTCFFCGQALPASEENASEPFVNAYMDADYFRLLGSLNLQQHKAEGHQSLTNTERNDINDLPNEVLNQGYYERFFVEIERLGRGHGGAVFRAQHVLEGTVLAEYAVKKIAVGSNKTWLHRMLKEVRILDKLKNSNIVDYKHCWVEVHELTKFGPPVPCLFILMELADCGNLEDYVLKRYAGPLTERLTFVEVWSLFLDVCQGLNHLHSNMILHRDLKPNNLLLKKGDSNVHSHLKSIPTVLISDFGECENLNETSLGPVERTGYTGTLEFTAPELLKEDTKGNYYVDYSQACDLWSLGMILYFLLNGKLPYSNMDDLKVLRKEICEFRGTLHMERRTDVPDEVYKLLLHLLSRNPNERPSCAYILKHFDHLKEKGSDKIASLKRNVLSIESARGSTDSTQNSMEDIADSIASKESIFTADKIPGLVISQLPVYVMCAIGVTAYFQLPIWVSLMLTVLYFFLTFWLRVSDTLRHTFKAKSE
jgi:serine/threonine protein kinase